MTVSVRPWDQIAADLRNFDAPTYDMSVVRREAADAGDALAAEVADWKLLVEDQRDRLDPLAAEVAKLTGLQRRLFDECETAGWDPDKQNTFAEEIAHLHEEVSEAFREWRLHKNCEIRTDDNGKPTGIPIEFADVLIGMFYNAELHGFDLLAAVELKHAYNLTRSYEAEGRRLHDVPERSR